MTEVKTTPFDWQIENAVQIAENLGFLEFYQAHPELFLTFLEEFIAQTVINARVESFLPALAIAELNRLQAPS